MTHVEIIGSADVKKTRSRRTSSQITQNVSRKTPQLHLFLKKIWKVWTFTYIHRDNWNSIAKNKLYRKNKMCSKIGNAKSICFSMVTCSYPLTTTVISTWFVDRYFGQLVLVWADVKLRHAMSKVAKNYTVYARALCCESRTRICSTQSHLGEGERFLGRPSWSDDGDHTSNFWIYLQNHLQVASVVMVMTIMRVFRRVVIINDGNFKININQQIKKKF